MEKINKSILIFLCIDIFCFYCLSLHAQQYKDSQGTFIFIVPDFYHYRPQHVRDTLLVFRCYDKRDSLMNYVDDYDKVKYYSLFKEYIDSFNTYKDDDGTKKFLPVSYIVRRYDRLGSTRWMSIQYPGNKYGELKDNRDTIVRTDTVAENDSIKIFRCYKTTTTQY